MPFKTILDSLEGLDEATQKMYVQLGEKYVYNSDSVVSESDYSGQKSKTDEFRTNNTKLQKELNALKEAQEAERTAIEQAKMEADKKAGRLEEVEKTWQSRLDTATKELGSKLAAAQARIEKLTVGTTSAELAGKLKYAFPDCHGGVMEEFRKRLAVNDSGDGVIVVNEQGQPTSQTLEELLKAVSDLPHVKPLLVGTHGSGSGAPPSTGSPMAAGKKYADYTPGELVALHRSDPKAYDNIVEEHKKTKKK